MNIRTKEFIWFHLPAIFWACLIFIASSIPSVDLPTFDWLSSDKVIHLGIFLVLAGLTYRALIHQRKYPFLSRQHLLFTVLFTSLYGAFDEFHQFFVPGREADPLDWLSDAMGAVVLILLVWLWRRLRKKFPSRNGGAR